MERHRDGRGRAASPAAEDRAAFELVAPLLAAARDLAPALLVRIGHFVAGAGAGDGDPTGA
jgi:hypothetical protein